MHENGRSEEYRIRLWKRKQARLQPIKVLIVAIWKTLKWRKPLTRHWCISNWFQIRRVGCLHIIYIILYIWGKCCKMPINIIFHSMAYLFLHKSTYILDLSKRNVQPNYWRWEQRFATKWTSFPSTFYPGLRICYIDNTLVRRNPVNRISNRKMFYRLKSKKKTCRINWRFYRVRICKKVAGYKVLEANPNTC